MNKNQVTFEQWMVLVTQELQDLYQMGPHRKLEVWWQRRYNCGYESWEAAMWYESHVALDYDLVPIP
jgi:hypothetical protein